MRYKLLYTNRAVKDLAKLNPTTKERIGESLEEYADAPFNYAKKMVDPALGSYRFRVGDYRVIFDIEGED